MTALLWTFPTLMFASIVIGWAAELTAVHLSAGIALALLAWLQTAPEFAVEATIAWHRDSHLALANLTGSLRLLLGFGWPMIFFIYWLSNRRRNKTGVRNLILPESFAVEAAGLAIPVIYFLIILLKGTWNAVDGVILCAFYGVYFWLLNRERKFGVKEIPTPHDADDDAPWVVRQIERLPNSGQYLCLFGMFALGGVTLWFVVHPFLEALKTTAAHVGVSEFVFIQWIAPVASELPEKVTAFNWARKPGRVAMAIVNMLSSVTSQWTLLAGLVPILFTVSAGHWNPIVISEFQRHELLLTIAQSAVAVAMLADLKIRDFEAALFFALWLVQFLMPSNREPLTVIYFLWFAAECARLAVYPSQCVVWKRLKALF